MSALTDLLKKIKKGVTETALTAGAAVQNWEPYKQTLAPMGENLNRIYQEGAPAVQRLGEFTNPVQQTLSRLPVTRNYIKKPEPIQRGDVGKAFNLGLTGAGMAIAPGAALAGTAIGASLPVLANSVGADYQFGKHLLSGGSFATAPKPTFSDLTKGSAEGAAKGFEYGAKFAPFHFMAAPGLAALAASLHVSSPILTRLTQGLLSVGESYGLEKATGGQFSPMQAAISFGVGAAAQPYQVKNKPPVLKQEFKQDYENTPRGEYFRLRDAKIEIVQAMKEAEKQSRSRLTSRSEKYIANQIIESGQKDLQNIDDLIRDQGIDPVSGKTIPTTAQLMRMQPKGEDVVLSGEGWPIGLKKSFDDALYSKNAEEVKRLLPQVPDYYKTKFAPEITAVIGQSPMAGLQPGFAKLNEPLVGTMRDVTDPTEWAKMNAEFQPTQPKGVGGNLLARVDDKTMRWIKATIMNDETSSDAELSRYFMEEGGITKEMADYAVGLRNQAMSQGLVSERQLVSPLVQPKGVENITQNISDAKAGDIVRIQSPSYGTKSAQQFNTGVPRQGRIVEVTPKYVKVEAVGELGNKQIYKFPLDAKVSQDLSSQLPTQSKGVDVQDAFYKLVNERKLDQAGAYAQQLPDTDPYKQGMLNILDSTTRFTNQKEFPAGTQPGFMNLGEDILGGGAKPTQPGQTTGGRQPSLPDLTAAYQQGKISSGEAVALGMPQEIANNPVNKIINALSGAESIRGKQEALYSKERSIRIARVAGVGETVPGEAGYHAQLGQLKGELPKVQFEGVRNKLSQPDIDNLFNQVESAQLSPFEKVTAKTGLAKLLGGEGGTVPTEGELGLLNQVFPPEFVQTVLDKRPLMQKLFEGGENVLNLPRAMMATADLSAPLRQGVFLIGRPKTWIPAFRDMFKYFGSEKAYQGLQDDIQSRPTYETMREAGLSITDTGKLLNNREEMFMSNLSEKIPVFGKLARASNRAYSGFLNKLRADTFDDLLKAAQEKGATNLNEAGDFSNPEVVSNIAKFVNAATGRGDLPSFLQKSAPLLNATFFSPRLMASRLTLLNPATYVQYDSFTRGEALKSLFTFAGTAMTILGLSKLGGAEVGTDPRSADFAKIKVGNTRYDVLGGFQQYMVAGYRLLSGEMVSSTTGREFALKGGFGGTTRADILARFFQSKENPIASFITDLLQGETAVGEPVRLGPEIIDRFIPMVWQDMFELAQDKNSPLAALQAIPGLFGVGVNTYGNQIPMYTKTATGKPSVQFRQPPSLGETLLNKATGSEVTNVPEEQQQPLIEAKRTETLKGIELDKVKAQVLETGQPQVVGDTLVFLKNGIVTTKKMGVGPTDTINNLLKKFNITPQNIPKLKSGLIPSVEAAGETSVDSYAAEAQLEIDKYDFQKSGKNFQVQGDNVFRRTKDGKVTVISKIDYDTNLNTQKMENAKKDEDYKTWVTLAEKQYENYQTQMQDPSLDELEKIELQQKIDTLIENFDKYKGYGGFKKGKKITIKKVSFKKTSPIKISQPKLSPPKITAPTYAKIKPQAKVTQIKIAKKKMKSLKIKRGVSLG